jgi:hypothetical protein
VESSGVQTAMSWGIEKIALSVHSTEPRKRQVLIILLNRATTHLPLYYDTSLDSDTSHSSMCGVGKESQERIQPRDGSQRKLNLTLVLLHRLRLWQKILVLLRRFQLRQKILVLFHQLWLRQKILVLLHQLWPGRRFWCYLINSGRIFWCYFIATKNSD